jgi:selenocysteine lyase/cysteine desulfurase
MRPDGITSRRAEFAVPDDVAYFNTANLGPLLYTVRDAGERALQHRAAPWTIRAQDWFTDVERLRALVGRLMQNSAEEPVPCHGVASEGVALIPATSYGFAVAARNLPLRAGQRVVVLAQEYPSGVYTWRRHVTRHGAEIRTVHRDTGQSWADAVLAALDEQVAIISVPQVHWTDGAWVDLAAVSRAAHDLGAALVLDVSQSLGAVPFDARALDPDFVVSVGYKWLLGPFGRSYMWVAERHRGGEPLEENWIVRTEAEDFARLTEYRDDYQDGARRFDHGQRTQFELTPMAIAAVAQVLSWGVEAISAHLGKVTDRIGTRLRELGLTPLPGERGQHMLGVELPQHARSRAAGVLAEAGCYASVRATALRLAPHLHTTEDDIARLGGALGTLLG